jgi:hypothetical protein
MVAILTNADYVNNSIHILKSQELSSVQYCYDNHETTLSCNPANKSLSNISAHFFLLMLVFFLR